MQRRIWPCWDTGSTQVVRIRRKETKIYTLSWSGRKRQWHGKKWPVRSLVRPHKCIRLNAPQRRRRKSEIIPQKMKRIKSQYKNRFFIWFTYNERKTKWQQLAKGIIIGDTIQSYYTVILFPSAIKLRVNSAEKGCKGSVIGRFRGPARPDRSCRAGTDRAYSEQFRDNLGIMKYFIIEKLFSQLTKFVTIAHNI